jgi:hypothetical protein
MSARLSSTPVSIVPSPAELNAGYLGQCNLELAIRALSRDGLVVLEDMVDHTILDRLNVKMVEDAYELQAREDSPFNYNKGNIQQDPPLTNEWFSDKIYTSRLAPLSKRPPHTGLPVLTPARLYSYSSNVHCSGSQTFFTFRVRQHCTSSNSKLAASIPAHTQ